MPPHPAPPALRPEPPTYALRTLRKPLRVRSGLPSGGSYGAPPARPAAAGGLRLVLFRPPYEACGALGAAPDPARLPTGAVVCLVVAGVEVDWRGVEQAVHAIRRRVPAAPVVLEVDPGVQDLLFVTARVARMRVRAVLLRGEPAAETLRRQLTRPLSLADDVVEWLATRGMRLPPATTHLIQQIFARAPEHPEISALLAEVGVAESSARFRLHKKLLPAPSRWLHAARALHAALRMQADPGRPLLGIAHELGYSDHSSLSNQMQRVFRLRPVAIRRLLGWEWLLDRWLRAEAEKPRRRNPRRG